MPAIISSTIVPRDVIGVELLAVELGFEQERREVVARLGEMLLDARVDVLVELAVVYLRLALLGRHVDVLEHHADEAAEDVGVLLRGSPSILAITRSGMCCA